MSAIAHCQHEAPRDIHGRIFVPQRDMTHYCDTTRDYSCNGTTECQVLCWPISLHPVERGVVFGRRAVRAMSTEPQRTCPTCGNELSDAMEFCPVCMLRKGLVGGVASGESSEEAVKPTPDHPPQRFENYELVTGEDGKPVELGRGAMGVTYKAFDVDLRLPVALKLISEKYLGDESVRFRFLREARAAASVRHTNVASVFHLGRTGSSYFYAMEFVEGETLESLIRRSGRLEAKLALEIAAQVAAGLAAVHEQKLVHRDIKPTNVMVSLKDGDRVTAKIIDLGLSKTVAETPSQPAISTPGAFAGTPEFASPEQFAGAGVDIRSDLYSLGVTLWEMLTAKVPFRGTLAEVIYQHQHAPLPLEQLIDVPQPIVVLLQVLLEKDPKWRFQDPAELVNALPKVTDAIKARRSVTHQNLRTISDEQLGAFGKAPGILGKLGAALATRKTRLIILPTLFLLITCGLILIGNTFFGNSSRVQEDSMPGLSATKIPEKSIAVLPFESLSDNKNDAYFADGVQDEILSNLARVSQLKVISRTSVMTYRSTNNRNLRSIANALGVADVVEGTVRRDGNRVRVTTELVDARTDETLWSDSYDRDLTDIFAIQSDIAQTVASKLSARLSPEEKLGMQEKPTENLEAYDLYLQAKASIRNSLLANEVGEDRQQFLNAIALLEQSTRMDSTFALAYCQIAKADDWLYLENLDATPERRAHGDAAVNAALRLKPNLPETHLAAAFHLYICYRDYQRARVHIAIAERDLPNSADALALAAYLDRRQGHREESTKVLEKAANLDPRNSEILFQLQATYSYLRQYRACEKIFDRLIELEPDKPGLKALKASQIFAENADLIAYRAALEALPSSIIDNESVFPSLVDALILSRDWKAARELVRSSSNEELPYVFGAMVPRAFLEIRIAKFQGEHPEMNLEYGSARNWFLHKVNQHPEDPKLLSALGLIDAYLGRKQDAIQEAKRAEEMLPTSKDALDGPDLLDNLATVYAWTNEPDLAFQTLNVSIKTPGGVSYGNLKLEPDWDPIRIDPRFDKLLAQLAPKE